MSATFTGKSFKAANVKAILNVSRNTILAYVMVAGDFVVFLPHNNLAF